MYYFHLKSNTFYSDVEQYFLNKLNTFSILQKEVYKISITGISFV